MYIIFSYMLSILNRYFGENVQKYPDIFQEVKKRGHQIGNHTFNHVSGWTTDNIPYYHNVRKCSELVDSVLFRPPYGKLKPAQAQFLQRHYRIVMWDVLSGDFDPNISAEQCFRNVVNNVRPGSIVVFHDSLKSADKLMDVLPRVMKFLEADDYSFGRLDTAVVANTMLTQLA